MKSYVASDLNMSGDPPSFDDVMLIPRFSRIKSRLMPSINTIIGGNTSLDIPIISSPMDTITGHAMAISLGSRGAMGVVHRFMSPKDHLKEIRKIIDYRESDVDCEIPVALAIGVGDLERERFKLAYNEFGSSIDWVAIDVANGHSAYMRDMIRWIKDTVGDSVSVMAGNVATGAGFIFLAEAGADAVRVGIGGGSICKTRIMTGFGVPTLASVVDCRLAKESSSFNSVSIIADGGIKYPSDLVKSLAAGADAIMGGRMFAGTLETPCDTINIDGKKMKVYRGMASKEVQDDLRGGLRPGTCAEGVSTYIPLKGKAYYILEEFAGGLRSAMTYANASNIDELRENSLFIRLTPSAIEESHAFGTKK